eukprot:Opistho-2@38366
MTRVTAELIAASATTKRLKTESLEQYLARITHANLAGKGIEDIENFRGCRHLSVLYLYENQIESMRSISCLTGLTHLYLQDNRIRKIEGLEGLTRVTKLYLNNNEIETVEGLESLVALQELYLQNQRIPEGHSLWFKPSVAEALSRNLRILNISNNSISSIDMIVELKGIHTLIAANNKIESAETLCQHVAQLRSLTNLDLRGNPICDLTKYRERIIIASSSLSVLDDKKIADNERRFLVSLKAVHVARQRKASEPNDRGVSGSPQVLFEDDFGDVPQLAYNAAHPKGHAGRSQRTHV